MPSKIWMNPFRDYGLKVCTSVGQISLVFSLEWDCGLQNSICFEAQSQQVKTRTDLESGLKVDILQFPDDNFVLFFFLNSSWWPLSVGLLQQQGFGDDPWLIWCLLFPTQEEEEESSSSKLLKPPTASVILFNSWSCWNITVNYGKRKGYGVFNMNKRMDND